MRCEGAETPDLAGSQADEHRRLDGSWLPNGWNPQLPGETGNTQFSILIKIMINYVLRKNVLRKNRMKSI